MPDVLPDDYRALARHGFDLAGYLSAQLPTQLPAQPSGGRP